MRARETLIFFEMVCSYTPHVITVQISYYQLLHMLKWLIYDFQRLAKIGPSRLPGTLKLLDMVCGCTPHATVGQTSHNILLHLPRY